MPVDNRDSALIAREVEVDEEANLWFTRLHSGTCTAEQIQAHKVWLDQDLMHRKAYRELEQLWSLVGDFGNRSEVRIARDEVGDSCCQKVTALHTRNEECARNVKEDLTAEKSNKWLPWAMAASVTFAVLGASLDYMNIWPPARPENVYQTDIGEQRSFSLADGSRMMLDTQTYIKIDFSENQRRVVLEKGQARFDVAHDKSRPFVVEAGKGMITALGTAFVVRKNIGEVLVTLIEGRVEVEQDESADIESSETSRELEAGQQLVYSDGGMSEAAPVNIDLATAWQHGRLIFEDHKLSEVVADINRYSKRKILIGDESLETIRITGVFKLGDKGRVIDTLKSYLSMNVTTDLKGNLILNPRR